MSATAIDPVVQDAARSISVGSKSFAAAARLFDPPTRASATMLYAWCRHCDDVIDGQAFGHSSTDVPHSSATPSERLALLEVQTRAVLDGRPAGDAAFEGLARVVKRHRLPVQLPLDHLAGFRMDVEGRRYRTIEDTLEYCYGVAGVVGLMMSHVMGATEERVLDRACDLGLAFQLTNIARDVIEDAQIGRVYLPETWLLEAGIAPETIAAPEHRVALAQVVARLLEVAEAYYGSASEGISALPARSAWAIATARGVYRQIGRTVLQRGPAAWDRRASTSRMQKVGHLLAGAVTVARSRGRPPRARAPHLWQRPR